ncbi:MAG: alpha amylase C-terminal domain-containing protein [Isosphaerales bacterium]
MPASQDNITAQTRMGANIVPGKGVTFRVWAPAALEVYVSGDFNGWKQDESCRLVDGGQGTWTGFIAAIGDGAQYRFFIKGTGSTGYKRDPYARELTRVPAFPESNCVVRSPAGFPWHDGEFQMPAFNDLIVYQIHIGTYYGTDAAGTDNRRGRVCTFLDVVDRLEYLVELGINALEPLPIVEFPTETSEGYNGTDYYSPEMEYTLAPGPELDRHFNRINQLLRERGCAPLPPGALDTQVNQLKALIDIFHVYGIAVLLDVVYNHAGGSLDDSSLYYFDRHPKGDDNRSLYFTDQGYVGGKIFAYWNAGVRQFLIDNAAFYVEEFHVDGFRYDEVTVIDDFGGWGLCQNLTDTLHFLGPNRVHVAEYWKPNQSWVIRPTESGGAGFDAVWAPGLRDAVRSAIGQASGGAGEPIHLGPVRDGLYPPAGFPAAWRSVQCVENHDIVFNGSGPRIARLSDSNDSRSWYARSRSRVATGLLLTAPGIPLLFMGQEFLEDKPWSDSDPDLLIYWDGLKTDQTMQDHLRFCRELIALRKHQPALRSDAIDVFHVHDANRVIAFHRWVVGAGRDVVVAVSLNESTSWTYALGFPGPGHWQEVFNSDVYDHWVNPVVAGNGGGVDAGGPPLHGLPCSAQVVIPANGMVVFARDRGD